ncbi:hypothetical protein CK222_30890 [Mesorhizobium sp. WSM3866]|nr:hypothetical protein CK222_30890 [Mesorhizobium sp. WSM3866]
MKYYAGLDVSVKETAICIVDETGMICPEMKMESHPEDFVRLLSDPAWAFVRIGLEAGPLSQWLFMPKPACRGVHRNPHTKAFLEAQQNKPAALTPEALPT